MKYIFHKIRCFRLAAQVSHESVFSFKWHHRRHKVASNTSTALPTTFTEQERHYQEAGAKAIDSAMDILNSNNWTTEVISGSDVIQSSQITKYGKIFKFQGVVDLSPENVLRIVHMQLEESTKWNKAVKSSQVLQKIDESTDVAHIVTSQGAGGLVLSRDFVVVRAWQKRRNHLVNGYTSTNHPSKPQNPSYVRGEQGPCAYVLSPIEGEPKKCRVQWLLCTNLKGWIPQRVIDQCISSAMMTCIRGLREHISNMDS